MAAVPRVRELNAVARSGTVRELHELDLLAVAADAPRVWWLRPDDAAIVLGSRQRDDLVDLDECDRLGLRVVRRRSGGGGHSQRTGSFTTDTRGDGVNGS